MLTNLCLNAQKLEHYNQRMKELRLKYDKFDVDINVDEVFSEVTKLSDELLPYPDFQEYLEYRNILMIQKDYREDFTGVYITDLYASRVIEHLTDYKPVENYHSPIYWKSYGVADNASQVLDYYDSICKEHSEYVEDKEFIIILTPMFRNKQPEIGGWRWHKWGPYIGEFEHKCEYLYNEEGIDYVLCFKIVEVAKCSDFTQ